MNSTHPLAQFKYCPKCGSTDFVEQNEKAKHCKRCGFTYYFNSCAATVGLIVNEKNELLVGTRASDPVKGTLDLPGGFVDMHETNEEAIIREVKEETNLDIESLRYWYSIPNIYVYSNFEVHTLDLVYICKVADVALLKADDDVSHLEFIRIADLQPELFGLQSVREIIKKIQKTGI